ncbi:MAG: hypothetical protein JNK29_02440, partial [Anaerolineales bacterium]|nr:hypothetical protein [Anaerolineales bacterium]
MAQSLSRILLVAALLMAAGASAVLAQGLRPEAVGIPAAPVAVQTAGVPRLAAGIGHTCALTADGGVKCWGANGDGQLGDGTTLNQGAPVAVAGLTSGVTAVATGWRHTCALTAAGGVKCWGWNDYGQLGDGTTTNRLTPVDVAGLTSGVTALAAGNTHTCALTAAGGAKCWGYNLFGQLGDGTTTNRLTPVREGGLTRGETALARSSS